MLVRTELRLEEQIGVRLLTRTTRSVSPTDAGEQLLSQLRPALSDIRDGRDTCIVRHLFARHVELFDHVVARIRLPAQPTIK